MRSNNAQQSIPPASHIGPKPPAPRICALPDEDRHLLQQHLQQPGIADQPLLGHVLRHKITTSRPRADRMYDDVVTGSSFVTYVVDGGAPQSGLLNHRARAGSGSGVIPVCSLLGAALIGMRIGQRAPLLCEDGTIVSLSVVDVAPSV